jgi:hypothetical protein
MTLDRLTDANQRQSQELVQRLSLANPVWLGRFYIKIKLVVYVPTHTSDPDLPGKCWIWRGATDKGPRDTYAYPKIKINGKTRRAHRWIFQIMVRPLGIHEDVHHRCENALCVNPWHLEGVDSQHHSKRGPPPNWNGDNAIASNDEIPF